MNVWQQFDAALQRHRRDLRAAKRWARRLGWVRVRIYDAGNASARVAAGKTGGVYELHERSLDDLIVSMFTHRHAPWPKRGH